MGRQNMFAVFNFETAEHLSDQHTLKVVGRN